MADSDDAARQQIVFWLDQFERWTALVYGALDAPANLINEAKLRGLRGDVDRKLIGLDQFLRSLSDAIRQSVADQHIRALQSLKLLRDDLLLVEIEFLRRRKLKPDELPIRIAEARGAHETFLKNWIDAGPGVDGRTSKWFWPKINNAKKLPLLRDLPVNSLGLPADLRPPVDFAREGVRRDLPNILSNAKIDAFTSATMHWVGIAYVLAQAELALRFTNDQARERDVASWYEYAAKPADLIRELLGAFDQPILEAIRDGDTARVQKLAPIRRSFIAKMALFYALPALECATLAAFPKPSGLETDVVGVNRITEKVTKRPGLVRTDRAVPLNDMLGYTAFTGFPLVYPLRDVDVPPGQPVQRFKRIAQLVLLRSRREAADHAHQAVFFASETATEQHELVADFLGFTAVRKTLAAGLKKRATIDLADRATRGKALAAAMASLAKDGSQDQALAALIALVQRYLTYFTRHTGDNVRDSGKPYLDSPWPSDLSGRLFYDCGVYAVEGAFDLMRAAQAADKLVLEFRFLLFPGHVALVVYHGNSTFAVNNARIFQPLPFPKVAPGQDARDGAGFQWARLAMQDAFSARYAIVPAAMPKATVFSNQAEPAFKKAMWAMFQLITGFDINKGVGKQYFDSAVMFEAGSTALLFYFDELRKPAAATKAIMTSMTTLALALYDLADILGNTCNFVDTKGAQLTMALGAHVNIEDDLVVAGGLGVDLTIWHAVDLVQKMPDRLRSDDQKKLANQPVRGAHLEKLNAAQGATACTTPFMRTLAQMHVAAQGRVKVALDAAPDGIKQRFGAEGSVQPPASP